jgi:hypothetical protein
MPHRAEFGLSANLAQLDASWSSSREYNTLNQGPTLTHEEVRQLFTREISTSSTCRAQESISRGYTTILSPVNLFSPSSITALLYHHLSGQMDATYYSCWKRSVGARLGDELLHKRNQILPWGMESIVGWAYESIHERRGPHPMAVQSGWIYILIEINRLVLGRELIKRADSACPRSHVV